PADPLEAGDMVALLRRELREPLTSIRGYAELIADLVRDPDEMASLARIIHGEALHLAWLLEELALLERLSVGEVALHIRPTDLNSVAAEAARRLGPETAGAVIALDLDAHLQPIPADRDALLQLVTGLARGALRGAGPGAVVRIMTTRSRRRALLSVSGGAPVQDPRGLGLPIARGIARLHGGRAWAEGRPGGPVIRVALPAVMPQARAAASPPGT
ncbi:MAG: sensor histidine kinase, partial [Chloroflexota bacterium]